MVLALHLPYTYPNFPLLMLWDAIHTHFVTLIGKWTIMGGWVKHLADKRDKVGETRLPKFLG